MSGASYCYFCAQLPTLLAGTPAPMTLADFDRKLEFLPPADARYIASCVYPPNRQTTFPAGSAAARFLEFEFALRGEIARLRLAGRAAEDAARYPLPPETGRIPGLKDEVARAAAAPDPQERELRLDEVRWRMLSDLERGMAFSREAAVCYRLKLALLLKEQRFRREAGKENFTTTSDEIDRKSAE